MIQFTADTLRDHYMADLLLPDTFHGRPDTPKVRNIQHWKAIEPFYGTSGTPMEIDLFDPTRNFWVWSDPHFYHNNIIDYANRPYPNLDLMHQCLRENYRKRVMGQDVSFWLGDIGFKNSSAINALFDDLPGYKIHIVGNHDMDRDGKLARLNFNERYVAYPLMVTTPADEKFPKMTFQILMTHYHLDNVPKGCINIHGHLHQWKTDKPWNVSVCVEHTAYHPVNLRTIALNIRDRIKT
jgi:calcineurin-like phosphoesterase family protein